MTEDIPARTQFVYWLCTYVIVLILVANKIYTISVGLLPITYCICCKRYLKNYRRHWTNYWVM